MLAPLTDLTWWLSRSESRFTTMAINPAGVGIVIFSEQNVSKTCWPRKDDTVRNCCETLGNKISGAATGARSQVANVAESGSTSGVGEFLRDTAALKASMREGSAPSSSQTR